MGRRWNGLWLSLAFLSELAALGVLAAWGWRAGSGAGRWLLAAGLPVAAAVLWGAFAAPRARFDVPAARIAVKSAVLGGAVVALVALGHPASAAALAVASLLGAVVASPPALSPARRPAGAAPTRTAPGPHREGPLPSA
ncbi:YrdB family protein [Blastococcus aurantiacus]|uniref:YrdB family protein n=1 Tax=Blastococcus aurantiacus TaxID=1550231 RepID=UPI000B872058